MITWLLTWLLIAATLSRWRLRPGPGLRDLGPELPSRTRLPRSPVPPWRRRSRRPGPADVAAWCDALAREVRSGTSLANALRSVAPPDGSALVAIPHDLARGRPLAEALAVPASTAHEAAALMVLSQCALHGGPASQPLDQVATTLRRRAADAAERVVHSSQARLSALVMTVLPGAVLLLLMTTSTSVRSVSSTPTGLLALIAGLGLNGLGWWWMRRVIAGRPR